MRHDHGNVPPFTREYTDEQIDAMAEAYVDRGIRPASKVVALAEAGELVEGMGPFKVIGGDATVRGYARKLRLNRAGEAVGDLASLPPRDAVEALRRRALNLADWEMKRLEKRREKDRAKPLECEQLRQVVRLTREIAALPGPNEPRPAQPGQRDPNTGKHNGGHTRGGLAGQLLADHERERRAGTVTTPHTQTTQHREGEQDTARGAHTEQTHRADEAPGSAERSLVPTAMG